MKKLFLPAVMLMFAVSVNAQTTLKRDTKSTGDSSATKQHAKFTPPKIVRDVAPPPPPAPPAKKGTPPPPPLPPKIVKDAPVPASKVPPPPPPRPPKPSVK